MKQPESWAPGFLTSYPDGTEIWVLECRGVFKRDPKTQKVQWFRSEEEAMEALLAEVLPDGD